MSQFSLKKSLRRLKNYQIAVDPHWQASARLELLQAITKEHRPVNFYVLARQRMLRLIRTGLATLGVSLTFIGGFTGLVKIAQASLPGDTLYVVKRGWERVKYNLAIADDQKVRLEVLSTQKRVDELSLVVKRQNSDKESLNQALNEVHRSISTVKYRLDTLKVEDSKKAIAMAKLIDKHADTYTESLKNVKKEIDKQDPKVNGEVGKKVNLALLNAEGTGIDAVQVLVNESPIEDAKDSLAKKILATIAIVNEAKSAVDKLEASEVDQKKIDQAKELVENSYQILNNAKRLLEQGALSEAMEKLVEGKNSAEKLEKITEEAKKAPKKGQVSITPVE